MTTQEIVKEVQELTDSLWEGDYSNEDVIDRLLGLLDQAISRLNELEK